jgi:hypothetical protein
VKFDVADQPARRFRLVYADLDARTRGVLAIGVRDEHATYRQAVGRIGALEALDADTRLPQMVGAREGRKGVLTWGFVLWRWSWSCVYR